MKLADYKSFRELAEKQKANNQEETLQIINMIFNTCYRSEIWIGQIIDFLNDNDDDKYYSEYYLRPEGSFGTRKKTYRFISTEEDMPHPLSIGDDDVQTLIRLNAQPKFILFDYKEDPSLGEFGYANIKKTLREVLECIGMSNDIKEHLCEFCFDNIKRAQIANVQPGEKSFNKDLWKPLGIERVDEPTILTTKHF